jgi:N-glycosylase/DNA lyase
MRRGEAAMHCYKFCEQCEGEKKLRTVKKFFTMRRVEAIARTVNNFLRMNRRKTQMRTANHF